MALVKEIAGHAYVNIGLSAIRRYHEHAQINNYSSLCFKKPTSFLSHNGGHIDIALWMNTDLTRDSDGLFIHSYDRSYRSKKYGYLLEFQKSVLDNEMTLTSVSANQIFVTEEDYPFVIQGLDRLRKILEFADHFCCDESKKILFSLDWDYPMRYCQFCGKETGIEPTEKNEKLPEVVGRFGRLATAISGES